MAYGSFKTIPNPLKQLPAKNLIIPEAVLGSNCLYYYDTRSKK
jgi:hypothetical protein